MTEKDTHYEFEKGSRAVASYDVDGDALAESLREIADGIDEGNVLLQGAESGMKAQMQDPVVTTLTLEYITAFGREDLTDPVTIDVSDTDD